MAVAEPGERGGDVCAQGNDRAPLLLQRVREGTGQTVIAVDILVRCIRATLRGGAKGWRGLLGLGRHPGRIGTVNRRCHEDSFVKSL
jgi:hypothetical protein